MGKLNVPFTLFIALVGLAYNVFSTVLTIKRGQDIKIKVLVTILIWWLPIIGSTIALLVLPKKVTITE